VKLLAIPKPGYDQQLVSHAEKGNSDARAVAVNLIGGNLHWNLKPVLASDVAFFRQ